MKDHTVVNNEQWLKARKELLTKEKELTKLRDEVSALRRELPWVNVRKKYVFKTDDGEKTLVDLFDNQSQLIIYHFMFVPQWQQGCTSCSFWADNFNSIDIHLKHRDINFLCVSRNTLDNINAYKRRMGWSFKWVSSLDTKFNYDFGVSFDELKKRNNKVIYNYKIQAYISDELPGVSVFFKDKDDVVYHTYSTYSRGLDILNGAYHYIDLTPKGRDENGKNMAWLKRRDQYD